MKNFTLQKSNQYLCNLLLLIFGTYPFIHYKMLRFENLKISGSEISLLAVSVVAIEALIAFLLAFRLIKSHQNRKYIYLFWSFLLLVTAEAIYGFNIFDTTFLAKFVAYICFPCYTLSSLFILFFLFAVNRSALTKPPIIVTVIVLFLGGCYLNWEYVLKIALGVLPNYFYKINALVYAPIAVLIFTIALVMTLKENRKSELIFYLAILLQYISDFAIRFNEIRPQYAITGFEFGWQFSIFLFGIVIFNSKQLCAERTSNLIVSLRSAIAVFSLVAMLVIMSYLFEVNVIKLENAFSLTHFLLAIFVAFIFSNTLAMFVSLKAFSAINYIRNSKQFVQTKNRDVLSSSAIPFVQENTGIFEIDEFIDEYNALSKYTSEMLYDLICVSKEAAIAKTTQMLAHDVRKPFSILKMGLDMLGRVKSMSEVKQALEEITPEVDRAITSVNGLINDVMEIGRTSAPLREPVSVQSLLESSLNEVGRMHSESNISFRYELKHNHMLYVDPLKIGRVFSNIFSNAMQAMKGGGHIWIKTSEDNGMITFCLGNNGSFITAEDLPHLFEAFFTKNKKGGTGLGLAIAQKAVLAHSGKIWCESSVDEKTVEFFFTLPAYMQMLGQSTALLPEKISEISERYKNFIHQETELVTADENASSGGNAEEFEREIVSYVKKRGCPLTIAIIDDEAIYRNNLQKLIEGVESLKDSVLVEIFSCSQQLLEAFAAKSYDFLICDIDLGDKSLNGYEIAKTLRKSGHKTAICIHSNRSLPEDYAQSVEVGAQAFLPKPLSRFFLVKFMGGIVKQDGKFYPPAKKLQRAEKAEIANHSNTNEMSGKRDRIIYIDDDKIYRTYAISTLNDAHVLVFRTPEELRDAITNNDKLLDETSAIITDQYFGSLSAITGLEFAADLRKNYGFQKPIIINSNEEFTYADLQGIADLCLPKKLKSWAEIKAMLPIPTHKESEKLPSAIEYKPHTKQTEMEHDAFSKIKHNIRNALSGIELVITNMRPNEKSEDFTWQLTTIAEYLTQLTPYFPQELITDFSVLFDELRAASPSDADASQQIFSKLTTSLESLKNYHYFVDDRWKSPPDGPPNSMK